MYWFNLWRQVRNPDDSGFLFPPQGEFFQAYQPLEPEHSAGTTWPVAGPGEPEGANLANAMMQFVFGNPVEFSEDIRLNDTFPLQLQSGAPTTDEERWLLGKMQRGAYDPLTGAQNAPAFDAAQSIFRFAFPGWSPHGKSYGGWQPIPLELQPDCSDGGTDADIGFQVPSYEIFFTALRKDVSTSGLHGTPGTNADGFPTMTYAGTCPCGAALFGAGHVLYLAELPFATYVYVASGSGCHYNLDRFDFKEWIQGPYEGGALLQHTEGKQLQRAVHSFITDYRGTPAQRTPDTFQIEKIAFDFQRLITSQYALAPARGHFNGVSIEISYPRAVFSGTTPAGTLGQTQQGTSYSYAEGFVLAGAFAKATALATPTTIEILDGDSVVLTLALTPDDSGAAQALGWLATAVRPAPLKLRLGADAQFTSPSGKIEVECNELLEYKPEFWDAYLITRMASTRGGIAQTSGVDARGKEVDYAKQFSDDYFSAGCVVNGYTAGVRDIAEWVNDNPVYDCARRLCKDQVRIARRQEFLSYEVSGGKSILRFKRFAYGLKNTRVDVFEGIAPPLDPVQTGDLVEQEEYIVRGGTDHNANRIVYQGAAFHDGQRFIAAAEVQFEVHGDAQVFVYDGIRAIARKKGFSNEWVSFIETKCYHPSATSIWKAEAYSDYFTWCNRCHFYSGTAPGALRKFFNYNYGVSLDGDTFKPHLNPPGVQAQFISPEAPSGYNYTMGANTLYGGATFYKSCQIYEAPIEIESCVVDDVDPDAIKITFRSRFRAHANAPATVGPDPLTWSSGEKDALRNTGGAPEDYRTPDNAIREYALSEVDGNSPCVFRTGDSGTGSGVAGLPDNPFGSCYPHFFFVKLIPLPYEDGNDRMDAWDTRCTVDAFQQMEVSLRAMCEGFVDGQTSQDLVCRHYLSGVTTLFDFSFENLCFQAFGGKWIGSFSLEKRPDNAVGHGPLPNTVMYAEVSDRLASAVNLLDRARIDLPVKFYYTVSSYSGDKSVTVVDLGGGCNIPGTTKAYADGLSPPAADTLLGTSGPFEDTVIGASRSATLECFGGGFGLGSSNDVADYYVAIDPDFIDAVPQLIRDLFDAGMGGFIARKDTQQTNDRRETVAFADSDGCCLSSELPCPGYWFENPNYYRWVQNQNIVQASCVLVTAGRLEAPGLLSSDYKIGSTVGGATCLNGPSSSVTLTIITDNSTFIQVPLVDAV